MNLYMPPHKHVGSKNKPGQIVNPVPIPQHNEKPLEKLIEEYIEKCQQENQPLPKKYWDIRK